MAQFKNLEMATALSMHHDIKIEKSIFGLRAKAVYQLTGSPLEVYSVDYAPEASKQLERLLSYAPEMLLEAAATLPGVKPSQIGNTHMEACVSADRKFAAVQLFRYSDLMTSPITDMKCYEGDAVAVLFEHLGL